MKEQEYIDVSDRVKVSNALEILRDITPSISSIINSEDYTTVIKILSGWEDNLFNIIETEEY